MKSMLGLLATVAMTSAIGGAVPNSLITNYQINHGDINPLRSPDDKLVSENNGGPITYHHLYIRPGTFEDIAHISARANTTRDFTDELFEKMANGFTGIDRSRWALELAKGFTESWNKIYDGYENTSKRNRLKINFREVYNSWNVTTTFQSIEIDSNTYDNVYFNNLNNAFNRDLTTWEVNNLGISKNDSWNSIWNTLKEKYSSLSSVQDGNLIELKSIEPYSYFTQGYTIKLNVKSNATFLSVGTIPSKFVLNTEENFDKINSIIENDSDVQQWKSHLADFNKRVERQIKEDVPKFDDAQKRTWKDTNAEIMKGYIRDWSIIKRLIFDELKIEELKSSIDKIQQDLDNLKQEIKNIQQKIEDILNGKDSSPCEGFDIASKVTKFIPEVGAIFSGIFGAMSIMCKVQSA